MRSALLIGGVITALFFTGCASAPLQQYAGGTVGEEVNNVCFIRTVSNWTNKDNTAFVFRHDGDEFLATMIGQCPALSDNTDPANLVTRRSAASRCMNPGDSLRFGGLKDQPQTCTINRLFRWEKAGR